MTINQQPDALSLSLNIKDFKIASTTSVPFVLKKGSTELVAQNYEPGQDGFVTISVRDMVHAQLSLAIPPSSSPYEQPNIAANFTAVIDGTEVTFRVLRGGVDKLADTAANFLTANFLTWQPQSKAVTYSSPEYLSYYAVVASVAKLKAYFTNAAGEVTSEQTITLHTLAAGKAYTLTTQYAAVSALLSSALPAFYDVWVEDNSGNRLTYIQRYYAGNMQSEQEDWVLFENSLGGMDCFRAYGATNFTGEHTHNLAEIDEVSQEYRVDTERKFEKNTGYLDKEQRRWLLDFFPSRGKYIYTAQALRTIVVTESNVTYTDKELPSNFSFTYKYADATALLNIARTATPTEVLTISVPDLGNFTVPPRLVEVARLPLTEGALFPVQSPYSEEWATTTAGAIFNFVKNLLGSSYEGGGGIGHTHGNLEVLQALSYAAGYLRYDGAKLKAGYADDIPEVINKVITLMQGLKSGGNIEVGEAIDSFLAGKGIVMTPDGRIQCNTIEARESAKFFELIYNRLSALEGDFVFTESGTVESVTTLDGAYKLIMRKRWDNDTTALDIDDVLRSKINNLSAGGEYASGWYRVIDKDSQDNSITVVMYSLSECPGGVNSAPTAGMMLHRWGNTNATKTDRQRCWYMSSSEGRLVWLTGVNKPIVDQDNYATFYGLPVNLPMFEGKPINYNQPYLYLRGLIVQDIIRVDYQGNTIYELTDRGAWSAVTAASSEPYYFEGYNEVKQRNEISTVYHRGSKWQCLHTNTQLEPKWNSPDWAFLEGNGEFSIDFSATNGFSFFYGRVNTDVQVEIFHGSVNITEDIKALAGVVVEWKRNSGNEAEDNSWVPTYLDSSKLLLHFTEADMGPSWLQNQSVTFTVTVYIPLGYGEYLPKTESFNF